MVGIFNSSCLPNQTGNSIKRMRGKLIPAFLLCSLMLLSSIACFSQDLGYARRIVKTLASPAFKGRGYVQNGETIASDYIASLFEKYGLVPLNAGSYFQSFNIPVNTFPGKMELRLNNQSLVAGADYLVDASSPSVDGTFPVLSIRQSDLNTSEKFDLLISKAQNAFLMIDQRPDSSVSKVEKASIQSNIQRLLGDESIGIKGLIMFTSEKLTWTTLTYQAARPVITVNKKDLDPASIKKVTVDVDAKFYPDYTTRNVVGMVRGTSNSDSTVVISAHFDHLGMMGTAVYFPGANDNASGTAMMLSFARYYGQHKPKYNTVFLAFSGEEIGLLGSKAFVEHPLIQLNKIKFLINFDLAGTGEEGIKVVNGSVFKEQFQTLVNLNATFKLLPKIDIRGEACISDHCRFYGVGVPSFFIYTLGGIQAYHDIYDCSETLPLTSFENYFKLMVKFFEVL
jgi:aminopeptidase YwaD